MSRIVTGLPGACIVEVDKIRAFVMAAYEALGGKHFEVCDDEMARDEHRKEAIATVKPLLDLSIRYCNSLVDTIEDWDGEQDAVEVRR